MHSAASEVACLGTYTICFKERLPTIEEDSTLQVRVVAMQLDAHARCTSPSGRSGFQLSLLNKMLMKVSGRPWTIATMRMLLERGADPNVQAEPYGPMPLHNAVITRRELERCNEEGIRVLLSSGARVDIRDREGRTALDRAERNGEVRAAQILQSFA